VNSHKWPKTKQEAYALQDERARQVDISANMNEPELIAAVETAYGYGGETAYAAAVVVAFPEMKEVERSLVHCRTEFPYIPGLFYFREGPSLVAALSQLANEPDLIFVSGHGIAHPRLCGIASHIGINFDRASVGCARRLLHGKHRPLDDTKGSYQTIKHHDTEIGVAYRSKDKVKPIYISPGHMCDHRLSREFVVRCLRGYRLPEPLRLAHLMANKHKRYMEKGDKNKQPVADEPAE
jgi:deoxyribonuclease V